MSRKSERNSNKSSSSNAFLTFWSTLPGILTGVAALITAIVGVYLALGPRNNDNHNAVISPTPQPTRTAEVSTGTCFEQEFAKVDPVEVGSGEQHISSKDGVTIFKLTDKHVVVGALRLRFYRVGDYFEVEKIVDSKCQHIEGMRNLSRQAPVDENNKPRNYDELEIPLGGQEYSLRLGFDAFSCTVNFKKL